LVLVVTLRSLRIAALAMAPNVAPLAIVFGALAWMDFRLDIGTMMTAGIALGITIDATLHFCTRQREYLACGISAGEAARTSLLQCGPAVLKTALVTGLGLLVLSASPFTPTARFGWMMAVLLGSAVVGDLVLLPALWMGWGRRGTRVTKLPPNRPHFTILRGQSTGSYT
jgi:predicted RND superfamily exporter protein